jgi:hypothetical protein
MMKQTIDLRSDTVTKPTAAMREAMARAEVGDDVYAEDPTVNALQEHMATMLGKESALFVPSGVMANQIAIKCHTQPGDEIIAEAGAHVFNYETGGAAFLSNVQVMTLPGVRGMLTQEQIVPAIRPGVYYSQRTSLICLENTHNRAGGCIYPLESAESKCIWTGHGYGMPPLRRGFPSLRMPGNSTQFRFAFRKVSVHPSEASWRDLVIPSRARVCFGKFLVVGCARLESSPRPHGMPSTITLNG